MPSVGIRLDAQSAAIAYTGDTGPDPGLARLGRGADLFIVDATDRPGETEQPVRNLLTAKEAGSVSTDTPGCGEKTGIPPALTGQLVPILTGTDAARSQRQALEQILVKHPHVVQPAASTAESDDADKNYFGTAFEADLHDAGIELLRPACKGEEPRDGQRFFKPLRQVIESIDQTFKG